MKDELEGKTLEELKEIEQQLTRKIDVMNEMRALLWNLSTSNSRKCMYFGVPGLLATLTNFIVHTSTRRFPFSPLT